MASKRMACKFYCCDGSGTDCCLVEAKRCGRCIANEGRHSPSCSRHAMDRRRRQDEIDSITRVTCVCWRSGGDKCGACVVLDRHSPVCYVCTPAGHACDSNGQMGVERVCSRCGQ